MIRVCSTEDVPKGTAISAGIEAEEARRLVVRGFFAELLARVPVPELRDRLEASIESRLAKGGA